MKKLLSLALVLTMLFTIISVPSVSAATVAEETVLAELDFANWTSNSNYTVSGTDGKKSASSSLNQKGSGQYETADKKKYNNTRSMSITTPKDAAISTGLGVEENDKILKLSQDANTSILRLYMADGSLSAKKGDVIKYTAKVYVTDFVSEAGYTKDGVAVAPTPMENVPDTWKDLQWGYMKATSGNNRVGLKNVEVKTNQWFELSYTYEITSDTDADLTSYGFAAENYSYNNANGYKNFPMSIYVADPKIVKMTQVEASEVTVTKIGEGTVTGDGAYALGSNVTLTATPDKGYIFDGWYDSNNALVSSESTYSFTASEDTTYLAYFIKEYVDGWSELVHIGFEEGDQSIAGNLNFWGKTGTGSTGNSDSTNSVSTYEAEAENVQPYDKDSFGTGVLKIDKDDPRAVATEIKTGIHTGRIDNIKTSNAMAIDGETYKASAWIYLAETVDGTSTTKDIAVYLSISGSIYNGSEKVVTLTKGQWNYVESEPVELKNSNGKKLGIRFSFGAGSADDPNLDAPALMYLDNFKIEKLDSVTVSAEATNGTVYGTGTYARGDSVTLNAGANIGYKFVGYYTKDKGELITTEPTRTFTVTEDTTIVAEFEPKTPWSVPSTAIYHFGSEDEEYVDGSRWATWDQNGDGKVTYKEPNEQTASETYCHTISYGALAEAGIYAPNDDPAFGDKLYEQKVKPGVKKEHYVLAGRFHSLGGENVIGVYVPDSQYKFTWWVNPVSTQLESDTVKLTISMQVSSSEASTVDEEFTLNVGEWNKIEWVFTADEAMAKIRPGIRYDWHYIDSKKNTISSEVDWALYDNMQIEKVTSWVWDDAAEPNNAWYGYSDQANLTNNTEASNNIYTSSVVKYSDEPIPKAPGESGDSVIKMDYSKPNVTEEAFNKYLADGVIKGDYVGMTYEQAYTHLTRLDNCNGNVGMRFNNIAAVGAPAIGSTYKISLKVYIAEKKAIDTGDDITTDTNVKIIGTHTKSDPLGDGKTTTVSVPVGEWTEISYIFTATEKGETHAPSLKLEVLSQGKKYGNELVTIFYVDDIRLDLVPTDNLDLTIAEDETNVTATANVHDIKEGDTVKAMVIIAAYDADGKLINVALSSANGEDVAINGTITATYPKNAEENVASYVAFLWDDLTNIRPYVKPVPLSKSELTE